MTYTAQVYEDEEVGGYWATVAELPGCYTQGETLDEVRENVVDAIACHLDRPALCVAAVAISLLWVSR